jgi:transcription initiation factor TFIID subunit 8
VATRAIERLVLVGLKNAGFDGSDPGALKRLEAEVVECEFHFILLSGPRSLFFCVDVKMLFERAHELANLANRSGPIVTDLLLGCKERNVDPEQLKKVAGGPRGKKRKSLGECFPSPLPSV